jgi:para-nitrobenzyl esterase
LALAALAIFVWSFTQKDKPGPVLSTPQGPVKGVITKTGVHNFMGIPFAAPPVGEMRWRAPGAPESWTETRPANAFSNICMQPTNYGNELLDRIIDGQGLSNMKSSLIKWVAAKQGIGEMSEDCLYLNVRTHNLSKDGKVAGKAQPVMVWIHGGGHQFGSADTPYYQADALPLKGVVLVTINYRLGALGYMAHPALSADDPRGVSGNYGTLDQIAALKWVKANISAYGGDPDNVTIFGESAGGWSVTELMASPLAAGLFHKAIGQSGASTYHLGQMADPGVGWASGYQVAAKMDEFLELSSPSAADLRAVPASKIVAAAGDEFTEAFHHVRDGVVFPDNVGLAFSRGTINAVPTLFGFNSNEGTLFFEDTFQPSVWIKDFPQEGRAAQIAALDPHFGDSSAKIVDMYGLDQDGNFEAAGTAMMGDEIFGVNVRLATRLNAAKGQPAYLYHFARTPPSETQTLGAFHAAEIPFVFGSGISIMGISDADDVLAEQMQSYWVNFATSGNPNGDGLPNWPEHDGQNWMQLSANNDVETGAITHFRKEKLDILQGGLLRKLEALATIQTRPVLAAVDPQSSE